MDEKTAVRIGIKEESKRSPSAWWEWMKENTKLSMKQE